MERSERIQSWATIICRMIENTWLKYQNHITYWNH